jgi:Tripartite tricarboxylate transporter family receptor
LPNLASSEQGLADFEAPTWFAVFLPRGASEPIFRKLNQAAFATADTPSVQERLHVLASRWWKDELTDYNPAGFTGKRKIGSVRYEFGVHSGIRVCLPSLR